jgi:hypothetical protein
MFKTTTIAIASVFVFTAGCSLSDRDAEVRVDLEINDVPAPELVYVGPADAASEFRDAIVVELQGEQSVVDSPVSYVVRHGDDTVGGFIDLPEEGQRDLGPALDAIAEAHGFALLDIDDDIDQTDDGYSTEENGLYMICNADACKELRCQLGVIDQRHCGKPLCANAADDFLNATPQTCNIPGFANPCLIEFCSPFGCYCAVYR